MPPSGNSDSGLPVDEVVALIKRAIKLANVSVTEPSRDLSVTSVYLRLNTVASRTAGGSINFSVPLIGMRLKVGSTITWHNSQLMEMTLIPDDSRVTETRGFALDAALVEAINTIRVV